MLIVDYLRAEPVVLMLATAVLGLCIGSFLNVVIHRLPLMMERAWARECRALLESPPLDDAVDKPFNLWRPRSQCPNCHQPISLWQNIPVLSFLFLRGRCAQCAWSIPWRYPGIEILTGALSLWFASHFGFGLQLIGAILLLWASIALCFIDIDHQLLPDAITLPFLWLGLAFNYAELFCSLHDAVLGAMLGYGLLWIVFQGFRLVTGKEGMGYGDFKLLALLGAWQGWQMLPAIILISSA